MITSCGRAYGQYAGLLLLSLVITTIGALSGDGLMGYWAHPLLPFIISLVLLFGISFCKGVLKKGLFFLFSFLEGVSLTPIVYYYLGSENQALVSALAITTFLVGVFLFLGYRAKNLTPMRGYLLLGLLALLILGLLELFFPFLLSFSTSLGLLIFTAYIAYNINVFKHRLEQVGVLMSSDEITEHVMSQYLNILNLFLYVLRAISRD